MIFTVLKNDAMTYNEIRVASFAPQVDITSASIPLNNFVVEVKTTDTLPIGEYCKLTDDSGNTWARYRTTKVENMGRGWQRVTATSPLSELDNNVLPATFYDGTMTAHELVYQMFELTGDSRMNVSIASGLNSITVNGFCPEQTMRERLQAVLLTCGAYVMDTGNDAIRIIVASGVSTVKQVPLEKEFWRPTLEWNSVITRIEVTAYTIREGEPQAGEDSVTDANGVKYRVTRSVVGISNTDPSVSGAVPNVAKVDGVMLVNQSNAGTVAAAMASRYFTREDLTFDCINNGEYWAGEKVGAFFDEESAYSGFAESIGYKFGLQSRSTIKIVGVANIPIATLTVVKKCGNKEIGRKTYKLPVGAAYDIECEYIVKSDANHKYVYRPLQDRIQGTLPAGGATVIVQHEAALDLNTTNHVLKIISVDDVEVEETQKTVDGSTVLTRTAVIA